MTKPQSDAVRPALLCALFFVLGAWAVIAFMFWMGFASFDDLWGHIT